ncbi:uncharacterized protein BO96DRAFT_379864 [Aspergillus niger CBS 101883]|uniref:Uncharacterized protein n=2 Tax=Aspergillus niger TaxID=5061 RepID=A2RAP1_ASPNC|nr:uncharacterized protein BO96DRAFT_379864 [Aspergillus niger CBS 101883]XP_059606581.1 hypothetical protein An18g03850 [Aspergillus niger]PYH50169.1 hypothetical protein BO96DRAFT_379864 [Aspergillus niger CBS 101883]CAK97422.1 hypothetical protein An18g03850 [Aspergillus niger]
MVPGGASVVTAHHHPSIRSRPSFISVPGLIQKLLSTTPGSSRLPREGKRKNMDARQWHGFHTDFFCHKVYPASFAGMATWQACSPWNGIVVVARFVLHHAMACQPISPVPPPGVIGPWAKSSAPDVCCTAQPTIRARCPCNDCPGISLHGDASLSRSRASNEGLSIALVQGAVVHQLFVKARKCRTDAKRRASRLMRPRQLPIDSADMAISRGLPVRPMPVRLADHIVLRYVPCWLTSSANAGLHVGCGGPKCLVVEVTYASNVRVAFGGYLAFLSIARYPPAPSQIGGYG